MTASVSRLTRRVRGDLVRGCIRSALDLVRGWARPGIRIVKPWVSAVTPLGWTVLAGSIAALVIGHHEGWTEVLVLGVASAVVAVGALAWTFGRMSYAAQIDLDSTRVVAGHEALGRVLVRNRATRTVLPARVELAVGRGCRTFELPSLARGAEHEILFSVPTTRRCVVGIGPVRSIKADPIGLFRRERRWAERIDLCVNPRTIPIAASMTGFLRDIEGVTSHNLTSSDVAFHALREYVSGDDLRTIHWRTTARTGRLMVRQFEETRRSHLLVVLSLRPGDYLDPDQFEVAVSTAGSLVLQARREERQVDVVASNTRLSVRSGPALLDQLSAVDLDPRAGTLRATVTRALADIPSASMVVLVTGAGADVAELHAAAVVAPLDLLTVAVRAVGPDGPRGRRRVGALTVLDVPELDDLPRAIRTIR
ncbi:MAG: DUF58 domain-containing protein [Dermatophilaceae bacterium]